MEELCRPQGAGRSVARGVVRSRRAAVDHRGMGPKPRPCALHRHRGTERRLLRPRMGTESFSKRSRIAPKSEIESFSNCPHSRGSDCANPSQFCCEPIASVIAGGPGSSHMSASVIRNINGLGRCWLGAYQRKYHHTRSLREPAPPNRPGLFSN